MRTAVGFALLAACVFCSGARAQTLDRSLIGNGGRVTSGGGQVVIGTLGQAGVGQSAGASNIVCHGWWCVERGTLVAVPDPEVVEVHASSLDRPRPNPARGTVLLVFQLAREGAVEVTVHDLTGARVATPLEGLLPAGRHEARWNGTGHLGERCPAGVYFITFSVEGRTAGCRRIVLLR